jgi:lysyl-tRNA synthetase class I
MRSLNIMLTRIPVSEINLAFQVQFPGFLKEYMMKETNDIFNEVSAETKEELKRNFEMSNKRFG